MAGKEKKIGRVKSLSEPGGFGEIECVDGSVIKFAEESPVQIGDFVNFYVATMIISLPGEVNIAHFLEAF